MSDNLDFYDAFAEVYDHWYWDQAPDHTLNLWEATLRGGGLWPDRKGRLLDLGCGLGAHLRGWAARGWEVEGLDGAPAMLRRARRSGAAPGEMTLYCADVRATHSLAPLTGRFQLVAAHFNFLNQFAPEELRSLLRNITELLTHDGVFATDVTLHPDRERTAGAQAGAWRPQTLTRTDGGAVQRTWIAGDRRWVETIHPHAPSEITNTAAAIGLRTILDAPFDGNFGPTPPDPAADRRLLAFERAQR